MQLTGAVANSLANGILCFNLSLDATNLKDALVITEQKPSFSEWSSETQVLHFSC
jgi:hypothetical protein